MLKCLELYANASGQVVNLDKSQITFSLNVNAEDQEMIMGLFEIDESNNVHYTYLGLPSFVDKNKKATFQMLKEKVGRSCRLG